ncbi:MULTISPECIES: YIP1 family protein [Shouchella]|uniref:Yip1 domain-containing protein n=1 Tax=Shouchella hunanensis TaxID=766894 RepID=A0ABY7WFC4_9BACI|nr:MULTISPECIES: YIP1 family protein [Shouchella]WDF05370.1 hypothetical protein PQ477_07910 [Shouchella hunanensis]
MKQTLLTWLFIMIVCLLPLSAQASVEVPYKTYTLTGEGYPIETQVAYVPVGNIGLTGDLLAPEDLFVGKDNLIYVADSGFQHVVVFDEEGKRIREIGTGLLREPLGVFVNEEGIYVADYALEEIVLFNHSGDLINTFGKPDTPLYGERAAFKPQKITVDRRGNLYVVSEGSTNGIVQLSAEGDFLGFFGVNRFGGSLLSFLPDLITSETQRVNQFLRVPPAPTNITIDEQGLVYTVTAGTDNEVVRRLNIAGANMLPSDIAGSNPMRDVAVGAAGNMVTISTDGTIYELDPEGYTLFYFGGKEDGTSRAGLFVQPSAIEVDRNGQLLVADREKGTVELFNPTGFTRNLHEGIRLFTEGYYVESEAIWQDVLQLNASFALAHNAIGQSEFKQQNYNKAMARFERSNNYSAYSNAFWEVRYEWMQEKLSLLFASIIGLITLRFGIIYTNRRFGYLAPVEKRWVQVKRLKLFNELLFVFRFIRHPIDSFYYVKENKRVSILSASILYVSLFISYLFFIYGRGFIFRPTPLEYFWFTYDLLIFATPIVFFLLVNYLVSTISDGEGRFRELYIGFIYASAPLLIGLVPLVFVSRILTLNEAFLFQFSLLSMIVYALVILFIMLKEIHDFTFWGTVRNVVLTIFGMILLAFVLMIVYVLFDQVIQFLASIWQEVLYRV